MCANHIGAAVAALIDIAITIDQKIVTDIAPPSAHSVIIIDRTDLGCRVRSAAADRMVDHHLFHRCIMRGPGHPTFIRPPLLAADDDRLGNAQLAFVGCTLRGYAALRQRCSLGSRRASAGIDGDDRQIRDRVNQSSVRTHTDLDLAGPRPGDQILTVKLPISFRLKLINSVPGGPILPIFP